MNGVSLEVSQGVTVLLGRNGAGKSTLSRVLAGAERPDSGRLVRDGVAVDERRLRAHLRDCGWLPQAFGAPPGMRVEQFLGYAAWLKEVDRSRMDAAVKGALGAADLVELRSRRLGQLSGGMLRRVGIAQAVVHDPGVLVLDEPTAGLDPEQRGAFYDLVRRLAGERAMAVAVVLRMSTLRWQAVAAAILAGTLAAPLLYLGDIRRPVDAAVRIQCTPPRQGVWCACRRRSRM